MINNQTALAELRKQVRHIGALVTVYRSGVLTHSFTQAGELGSFTVDRSGAGLFFGFGFCARLNFKLIDLARQIDIAAGDTVEISYTAGSSSVHPYGVFTVSEVHRDENTNALSVTAYDAIAGADEKTVGDLSIAPPYTVLQFAAACASALGLGLDVDGARLDPFETTHEGGANFEGGETLREALDDIAEATQTVYYANYSSNLVFKFLDPDAEPVITIGRADYITASAKTNRRLSAIMSVTDLGDNVEADAGIEGTTVYLRDNAFLDIREDVGELLEDAIAAVGGLTIGQYEMNWRGNYLLELGDCFTIATKDGGALRTYFLDDSAAYNGAYSQKSAYSYEADGEAEGNPSNLGDRLKQTYARVDKANKTISLVASEESRTAAAVAALQINTNSISASVESLQQSTSEALDEQAGDIAQIRSAVNAAMTSEAVDLRITQALEGGVSSVTTETGFTFNSDGLTVSRSGSEMQTTITEDGMSITRRGDEVLRADNEGVKAEDLHATTYLIIGENSRFEDFTDSGTPKTGCFWIGPTSA